MSVPGRNGFDPPDPYEVPNDSDCRQSEYFATERCTHSMHSAGRKRRCWASRQWDKAKELVRSDNLSYERWRQSAHVADRCSPVEQRFEPEPLAERDFEPWTE